MYIRVEQEEENTVRTNEIARRKGESKFQDKDEKNSEEAGGNEPRNKQNEQEQQKG